VPRLTLPVAAAGASSYTVQNGCDDVEQPAGDCGVIELIVGTGCASGTPPTFPVYALAVDELEEPLAWSLAAEVPVF